MSFVDEPQIDLQDGSKYHTTTSKRPQIDRQAKTMRNRHAHPSVSSHRIYLAAPEPSGCGPHTIENREDMTSTKIGIRHVYNCTEM